MSASASDLLVGINAGLAIELFPFRAVLDGPEGLMCDLPARRLSRGGGGRIPFMSGTVLDEGPSFLKLMGGLLTRNIDAGTIFFRRDYKTEDIPTWLSANYTPSPLGPDALKAAVDKVMSHYPDDPSAGSPFGTGDEIFGTGSGYKRAAAICTSSSSLLCGTHSKPAHVYCVSKDGDILFQGPRRFWSQTTFAPSYAYIFTDPQPSADPAVGVFHSAELPYFFGSLAKSGPPNVAWLSRVMLDYWISFAVSLTPNDGKGTSSTLRYAVVIFIFASSDPAPFRTLLGDVRRNQGTAPSPSL